MTRVGEVPVPDPRHPSRRRCPNPTRRRHSSQATQSERAALRRSGRRRARARARLSAYQGRPQAVVVGLARGGMPVAFEVARTLGLALDVFVVRKLGVPGQPELAIGAIASGGVRVLNRQMIAALGLSPAEIEAVAARERIELD